MNRFTVDQDVTVMAWIHNERHTGPNDARWQGIIAKGNNPRSYSLWTDGEQKMLTPQCRSTARWWQCLSR